MSELPEYILDRVFNAPRDMVWRAWTDPALLARWYGPGVETIIHHFDLKPGGEWRNEMKWGEKSDLSKMVFQEIVPEEKLVWLHSSSDAEWNTISNPMMPDWPRVLLTTVTFEDLGDKTNVRLVWVPVDPSAAEIACFAGAMENLGNGWGAGYAILDEMFAELQAKQG
ncbi:MAG: SRPBCC domain-containing protein [Rhodothermales bacterium]